MHILADKSEGQIVNLLSVSQCKKQVQLACLDIEIIMSYYGKKKELLKYLFVFIEVSVRYLIS